MNRIEFIGASGVGKTTLFNMILAKRIENDRWLTPEEARVRIIRSMNPGSIKISRQSIKAFLLNKKIFTSKHINWSISILKKYEEEIFDSCLSDYNPLIDLLISDLANDAQLEAKMKTRIIQYYMGILMWDVVILDFFNINDVIIYHDGIIHNNKGTCNYKYYLEKVCSKPSIRKRINPVGIVYCKISLDDNFNNRKQRIAEGKGTFIERALNDKELLCSCRQELILAESQANVMEKVGIPSIKVDMSLNNSKNAKQILQFINYLQ